MLLAGNSLVFIIVTLSKASELVRISSLQIRIRDLENEAHDEIEKDESTLPSDLNLIFIRLKQERNMWYSFASNTSQATQLIA